MTTITFSKRIATVFKRTINFHWDKIKIRFDKAVQDEDESKMMEDEHLIYRFNGFGLYYDLYADRDDDSDEIIWNTATIYFYVRVNNLLNSLASIGSTTCDEIIEGLSKIEDKVFTVCECSNYIAIKDGYCERCYPLVTTMDDNCPICMDNCEGVWYKTKCGHIFHKKCWDAHYSQSRIGLNVKCPLCRADNHLADGKEI
jgi:hypothetical protein